MRLKARSSLSLPQSQRSGRALSWLLSVLMVFTMMPGSALFAYADQEPAGPEITNQTEQIDVEYQAAVNEADRTLSVTATGTGTLTYKWWGCDDYFSEFYEITGATDSTYVIDEDFTSELGTTWYYCEISDEVGRKYSTVINVYVRKTVGIQWSTDTELTYNGYEQAPEAWATGLLPGDECEVYVDGETDAGENYVAAVSDLSSSKYRLPADNLTCSFSIKPLEVTLDWDDSEELPYNGQPQPMVEVTNLKGYDDCTVTLTGQSVNPTGGATLTATVTGLTGSDAGNYTLTQSGEPITIDYSIVNRPVTITARNQVVEEGRSIVDEPEAVVAVGIAESDRVAEVILDASDSGRITVSSPVIKNSSDVDVTGYYDITLKPGSFMVVSADPQHELSGKVEIPVNQYIGTPVPGATVILERGNTVYGVTTTGDDGSYTFTSVDPGWYNVIVTEDNISVTDCIYHSYEGLPYTYVTSMLPDGQRSTLNASAADLPIVVDGLKKCARTFLGSNPGSVRFTVTSEENVDTLSWKKRTEFNEGLTEIRSLPEADGMELQFFDMSLTATSGVVTTDIGKRNDNMLLIVIPYDMSRKNITVFRYHDGNAETLPRVPDPYWEVYHYEGYHYDGEYLLIQAKGFSLYAIGYEPESSNNNETGGGGGRTSGGQPANTPAAETLQPEPTEPDGTTDGVAELLFTDVDPGAYYAEAVRWAVAKGITKGRTATLFAPDAACTRAEIITFIWRAAGCPEVTDAGADPATAGAPGPTDAGAELTTAGAPGPTDAGAELEAAGAPGSTDAGAGPEAAGAPGPTDAGAELTTAGAPGSTDAGADPATAGASLTSFTDVTADAYYAKAVQWAAAKGIALGTGAGTFSPEAIVSRAEAVTFLHRAKSGAVGTIPSAFTDIDPTAYYANAVSWASASGVTKGTSASTFSPASACTRAQIVTFQYRAYN